MIRAFLFCNAVGRRETHGLGVCGERTTPTRREHDVADIYPALVTDGETGGVRCPEHIKAYCSAWGTTPSYQGHEFHPCLLYCLGDACRCGANSVVSHFDGTVGLVEVEHHHSSAVLQLNRRHIDRRKHVLQRNLHQLNLGRGVLVSEVVENDLVSRRRSIDEERDGSLVDAHRLRIQTSNKNLTKPCLNLKLPSTLLPTAIFSCGRTAIQTILCFNPRTNQRRRFVRLVHFHRPFLERPHVSHERELPNLEGEGRTARRPANAQAQRLVGLREHQEVGNAQNARDRHVVLDGVLRTLAQLASCVWLHDPPHLLC